MAWNIAITVSFASLTNKNHLGRLLCINHSLCQLLNEFRVQRIDRSLVHAEDGNAIGIGLNGDLGTPNGGGAEVGRTYKASTQTQSQPFRATQRRHVVTSERFGYTETLGLHCYFSLLWFHLQSETICHIYHEGYGGDDTFCTLASVWLLFHCIL